MRSQGEIREYTLENYEEQLNKQVIHMDQGVCYCPEFRATKRMHHYPSRKLQLARAVYRGELEPKESVAEILFQSLLSGQGERWQNFGESPEACLDAMLLSRAMMVKQGFGLAYGAALKEVLNRYQSHLIPQLPEKDGLWQKYMPTAPDSSAYLVLDDATYGLASSSARPLGEFFTRQDLAFYPEIRARFQGWEYFVYGLLEEGKAHLVKMIKDLEEKGIDTLVTLTGQSQYLWQVFAPKIGADHSFRVVTVLDDCTQLKGSDSAYLYAGSFYARYLKRGPQLNRLLTNQKEIPIRNCPEFTPLFLADRRVNLVNIWQRPVTADYLLLGFDQNMAQLIRQDALEEIRRGTQKRLVVFEPYAFEILAQAMPESNVVYYLELLA